MSKPRYNPERQDTEGGYFCLGKNSTSLVERKEFIRG